MSMVYDVSHNLARFEEYNVEGWVLGSAVSQPRLLAEEAFYAYKDVSQVVEACEGAGWSRTAARLRPVVVAKG